MTFRISTIKNYLMLVLIITTPLSLIGKEKPKNKVLKLGVIGLVHDHVNWILNRQKEDVKVVGIVETNENAILNYKKKYSCLLYTSPSPRDLSTSRMPSSA